MYKFAASAISNSSLFILTSRLEIESIIDSISKSTFIDLFCSLNVFNFSLLKVSSSFVASIL